MGSKTKERQNKTKLVKNFFGGLIITTFFMKIIFKNYKIFESLPLTSIYVILFFCVWVTIVRFFNKENIKMFIITILYIIIFTGSIFADSKKIDKKENRNLKTFPVDLRNSNFQNELNDWLNDHLYMRSEYIDLNNNIKDRLNIKRKENHSAFEGKDGWLYFKKQGQIVDFQKIEPFTTKQLKIIKKNLEEKKQWLENQNIKFYLFIPPSKNSVYPEFYPEYIYQTKNKSKLEQLIEYLSKNSDIELISPIDEIVKQKKEELLYYKSDTHWNTLGAFYGYDVLSNRIKKDFSDIEIIKREDFDLKYEKISKEDFDLGSMLNMTGTDLVPKLNKKVNYTYSITKGGIKEDEQRVGISTENKEGKYNVIMIRDSFAINMLPEISQTFKNVDYNWTKDFSSIRNKIETNHPDIVIEEILERNITSLFDNTLY